MADDQYFKNPNSDKKLVIFGHTHVAKIKASENLNGKKNIYANSGTWIDHKGEPSNETRMNFLTVTLPTDDDLTKVILYNFENEIITTMASDSLSLN